MSAQPCDLCVETADHPLFNTPLHVVHPEHGKPRVWSVRGLAVCPDCGSAWYRGADNIAVLLVE